MKDRQANTQTHTKVLPLVAMSVEHPLASQVSVRSCLCTCGMSSQSLEHQVLYGNKDTPQQKKCALMGCSALTHTSTVLYTHGTQVQFTSNITSRGGSGQYPQVMFTVFTIRTKLLNEWRKPTREMWLRVRVSTVIALRSISNCTVLPSTRKLTSWVLPGCSVIWLAR